MTGLHRRTLLTAAVAAPVVLRHARGETPIKIGMPLALTGPAGEIGLQLRHGAEFWAREVNAATLIELSSKKFCTILDP